MPAASTADELAFKKLYLYSIIHISEKITIVFFKKSDFL